MAKSILVIKINSYPTEESIKYINKEIGKDYFTIFLECGKGERESVSLLTKGRNTATLTKKIERLLNGKK
jgi:hypothetical protein